MTEYTAGDLVEAVKGESVIRGRLKADELGLHLWVGDSGRTPENIESYGFTLSIIEKAAAVVVLPTEDGLYLDADGDPWRLMDDRWLYLPGRTLSRQAFSYAPFTRLEPVSETAKKVLGRVGKVWEGYPWFEFPNALDEIARDFGVTK